MESFKPYLAKVATGASLSREEAGHAFDDLLSGEVTPAQGGAFLMALRVRGEALDEIVGAVTAMRGRMLRVEAPARRHRHRRHRRRPLGQLQHLDARRDHRRRLRRAGRQARQPRGVLELRHRRRARRARREARPRSRRTWSRCLAETKLGFMFAQTHHAAMRHVAPARVELGTRTIFNLLGPLANPAGVKRQLLGVFSEAWLEPLTQVLKELGSEQRLDRARLATGSTRSPRPARPTWWRSKTAPSAASPSTARRSRPADRDARTTCKGGDPEHNATQLRAVLDGARRPIATSPSAQRGRVLVIADEARTCATVSTAPPGPSTAARAKATLERLVKVSNAE